MKSAIEKLVVANEPVWAIGAGRNVTPEQISRTHTTIRKTLKKLFGARLARGTRILYGASERPDNADELTGAYEVKGLLIEMRA